MIRDDLRATAARPPLIAPRPPPSTAKPRWRVPQIASEGKVALDADAAPLRAAREHPQQATSTHHGCVRALQSASDFTARAGTRDRRGVATSPEGSAEGSVKVVAWCLAQIAGSPVGVAVAAGEIEDEGVGSALAGALVGSGRVDDGAAEAAARPASSPLWRTSSSGGASQRSGFRPLPWKLQRQ